MNRFISSSWCVKALFTIACFIALPASASVMYTYTGNTFTNVHDSLPGYQQSTANRVTGYFTTAEALTYHGTHIASVDVESFSFSDGISTITNSNVTSSASNQIIALQIGGMGEIVGWNISLNDDGWDAPQVGDLLRSISTYSSGAVSQDIGAVSRCNYIVGSCQASQTGQGWVNYSPGTWTIEVVGSSVPSPATFWILLSSLFVLAFKSREPAGS
jgi:hypothetical protein